MAKMNNVINYFRPSDNPPYESGKKVFSMPDPHRPQPSSYKYPEDRARAEAAAAASAGNSGFRMFGRRPPSHFPFNWSEIYDWFIYLVRMTPILRDVLDYLEWMSTSDYRMFTGIAAVLSVLLLMMALHYAMILLESLFAVIRVFCLPAVIVGKLLFHM